MIVPFFAVTRMLFQNNCRPNSIARNNQLCQIVRRESISQFQNDTFTDFCLKFERRFHIKLPLIRRKALLNKWNCQLSALCKLLKSNPVEVAKTCIEHIEFLLAQRIRRGQQMVSLYSRLWEERALRHFFLKMRRAFNRKGKQFIIGGSVLAFDWDRERISVEELERHTHELKICHILRKKASTGEEGEGTACLKDDCACPECDSTTDVHCWEPFIKEEDLTLWKMEEKERAGSGLFCYKIYGKYLDVTANDFLEVFLDTNNRTKWDTHAAALKVIDSEPKTHSDIIYWETIWPTLFSNRDYVFKRRYHKDDKNKVIIIMNKSTEHPMYPPTSSKARVTEYWSYMVIKSNSEFDKPGIEFSLTYFDNPGVSLPKSLSLWITVQGVPEYLKNLRREALAINERRKAEIKKTEAHPEPAAESAKPSTTEQEKHLGKESSKWTTCTSRPPGPSHRGKGGTCKPSPPERTGGSPKPTADQEKPLIDEADYFFLIATYMQKIKASLWL